jgi:drug/metabolite transporter (DMT)-like permease
MSHQDKPLLGILLMLGFCLTAPFADGLAKLAGAVVPVGVVLLARFVMQVVIMGPLTLALGLPWRMRGRVLRLVVIRTVLHILGVGTMFTALLFLPLAEAIAIAFVMPFLMLLLGKFVLGEEVGPRRLIACVVGFIGTLMVVQPTFAEVGWPALLPLGVAVIFALFMLVTRQIARETDPIALQAVSGAMAVVILTLGMGFFGTGAFALQMPDADYWGLLVAIGAVGSLGHLLMTWSLRFAPSATLAPMQYLEIPFATLIGWLMFRDLPNGLAAAGIMVTVGTGLYIVWRERVSARGPHPLPAEPPAP